MSVNYSQPVITARLNQVLSQISSAAGGLLQLVSGSGTPLVSIPVTGLFISSGVLIFGAATASVTSSGVVAGAQIVNGTSTPVSGLTVSTGAGTDIVLTNTVLSPGQNVTLTSGSITGR